MRVRVCVVGVCMFHTCSAGSQVHWRHSSELQVQLQEKCCRATRGRSWRGPTAVGPDHAHLWIPSSCRSSRVNVESAWIWTHAGALVSPTSRDCSRNITPLRDFLANLSLSTCIYRQTWSVVAPQDYIISRGMRSVGCHGRRQHFLCLPCRTARSRQSSSP